MAKYNIKELKTIIEAYDTDVTLANEVIFKAFDEIKLLFKMVRNTAMKHDLFNTQEWLNFETEMSWLTSGDPNIASEL